MTHAFKPPTIAAVLRRIGATAINPKVTEKRVVEACERRMRSLEDPGFCIDCGHEQGGCEPDGRGLRCEACGAPAVFGADELAIHLM